MSTRQRAGGQIHPHQRNVDFDRELLGDNIVLEESCIEEVQAVEQFSLDADTNKTPKPHQAHLQLLGAVFSRLFQGWCEGSIRGRSQR